MIAGRTKQTALLLAAFVVAATGAAAAAAESYDVEVWAIRATKKHKRVDPRLRPILGYLKRVYPQHTGFVLEKRAAGRTQAGSAFEAKLIENFVARVTPEKRQGRRVTLRVQIVHRRKGREDTRVNTRITMDAGKMQPWGFDAAGDDKIVIGVRVR